jgi:hypothetical protein
VAKRLRELGHQWGKNHARSSHVTTCAALAALVLGSAAVAGDSAQGRDSAAAVPPRALWVGGFETGDLSQWDDAFRASPERIRVVGRDGGIPPRQGARMARFEVQPGDHPPWGDVGVETAALFLYAHVQGHSDRLGDDRYYGFSMYLPKGFPYVANQLFNIIWEQHGDNDLEAPAKIIVDSIIRRTNRTPSFAFELNAGPAVSPSRQKRVWRLGNVVYDQWVDVVVHIRWAREGDGQVEVWLNGVKKVSASGISTWYDSDQSSVKTHVGYYRPHDARTAVLYLDALKTGATYNSVVPRPLRGPTLPRTRPNG